MISYLSVATVNSVKVSNLGVKNNSVWNVSSRTARYRLRLSPARGLRVLGPPRPPQLYGPLQHLQRSQWGETLSTEAACTCEKGEYPNTAVGLWREKCRSRALQVRTLSLVKNRLRFDRNESGAKNRHWDTLRKTLRHTERQTETHTERRTAALR